MILLFLFIGFSFASFLFIKKIINLFIDNQLTVIQILILILIYLFLGYECFVLPEKYSNIKFGIICSIFAFVFLYDYVDNTYNFFKLKKMDREKLKRYDNTISLHPSDWGTLSLKAEIFFKNNMYDKAIELQEKAVVISKNDPNEMQKLAQWKSLREKLNYKYKCPMCGKRKKEKTSKCSRCGYVGFNNIKDFLSSAFLTKIMTEFLVVIIFILIYTCVCIKFFNNYQTLCGLILLFLLLIYIVVSFKRK